MCPFHTHYFLGEGRISFADFLELMAEVMSQTTRWGNLATKLDGYVGFDTVQEQIRKKSLKRGFEFNLMVVGECIPWLPTHTLCVHTNTPNTPNTHTVYTIHTHTHTLCTLHTHTHTHTHTH